MKIKDVEAKVGITKANIRYYEKEGLISPKRNDENNYREYSEKDVEQLERIKVLRILGIPISDIRELNEGRTTLDNVMTLRLNALQEEAKNMEAIKRVCENLRQSSLSYDAVTEEVLLAEDDISWNEQLAKILKEDIAKEIISLSQFNNSLTLILSWGYFLCAIISFCFGDWLLSYEGNAFSPENVIGGLSLLQESFPFAISFESIFIIPLLLSIVCYIAVYFTANIKAIAVIFHISVLNLSPVVAAIYMFVTITERSANTSISGIHFSIFWLIIAIYVLILFLLSKTWNAFFSKARYTLLTAISYTAIMTLLAGILSGLWLITGIGLIVFTLYIGLNWFHSYQNTERCSRYYAITEGCRIMNLFGVIFDMYGLTRGPLVFR